MNSLTDRNLEDIEKKAHDFALNAHREQIRKSEPDKPMIMHPFSVANILKEYTDDQNVIAAGYLHDVVEDTEYTKDDIKKYFGSDIMDLVYNASEPDKSLSWEERKKHSIENTKELPLRKKLVIAADKINNLEDLELIFQKNGYKDFSNFKRGEAKQRWYYTEMYNSLIKNEDENLPIFKRLKEALEKVFMEQENLRIKNVYFKNNLNYYEELKCLNAYKNELINLKKLSTLEKPFVIEFTGTPRTGKTSIIESLEEFFRKGNFDIVIVEELTTSKYYKEKLKNEIKDLSPATKHMIIIDESLKQLKEEIAKKHDIILVDRSINDRLIWNNRQLDKKFMSNEEYTELLNKYSKYSKELINFLVITYADYMEAIKRDYDSSLSLEPRSFINEKNLKEYNNSLMALKNVLEKNVNNSYFINTDNTTLRDSKTAAAKNIMKEMRKEYIKSFKRDNNIK